MSRSLGLAIGRFRSALSAKRRTRKAGTEKSDGSGTLFRANSDHARMTERAQAESAREALMAKTRATLAAKREDEETSPSVR
jgi:hypothetical protein